MQLQSSKRERGIRIVCAAAALASTVAACAETPSGRTPRSDRDVAPAPSPSGGTGVASWGDGAAPDAAATAARPGSSPNAPIPADANVLLITIDSLRADMPWTGYARPIAPRLTALAEKSVVYSRAYAVSSYTSMSLGALLAGKYPSELKRDGFFFGTYAKDNVFFPELLKAKGVRTMGGHAHGYFKNGGFEQGFDQWDIIAKLKWNNTTDENVTSPELYAIAERQLGNPGLDVASARFFAWYHFMDPHDRYLPHTEEGIEGYGKSLRDRYDAEVTFTDRYVGKLLDLVASKAYAKRTVIVISSDHGEAFGEHGQFAHGFELWENLVRVPLIVSVPGVAPRRIDTPRSHIDLARTFLEVFGVAATPDMRGTSLVTEILGGEAPPREVFLDLPVTSDNDRRRGLLAGSQKVLSWGVPGLRRVYDVGADPKEEKAIAGEATKEILERFRAAEKSLMEIPPSACKENCLNGGYLRKDGGVR